MVEYHPISAKDLSRLHQIGPKVLPGIFLGYALHAGGIWKGDILVADIEELEKMDASEIHARIHNAKRVLTPMTWWKIRIHDRRWNSQTLWGRSGFENMSKKFSWRIRRVSTFTTSRLISGCRWSDKGLLVHVRKLHTPPSRGTQSKTVRAERRIISCSTEIHRRYQDYRYILGCDAGEKHRWLLERWWRSRIVWHMDTFHKIHWVERIYTVWGETDKKANDFQARHFVWPEIWKDMSDASKRKE